VLARVAMAVASTSAATSHFWLRIQPPAGGRTFAQGSRRMLDLCQVVAGNGPFGL
jgi:hypothetical protein